MKFHKEKNNKKSNWSKAYRVCRQFRPSLGFGHKQVFANNPAISKNVAHSKSGRIRYPKRYLDFKSWSLWHTQCHETLSLFKQVSAHKFYPFIRILINTSIISSHDNQFHLSFLHPLKVKVNYQSYKKIMLSLQNQNKMPMFFFHRCRHSCDAKVESASRVRACCITPQKGFITCLEARPRLNFTK